MYPAINTRFPEPHFCSHYIWNLASLVYSDIDVDSVDKVFPELLFSMLKKRMRIVSSSLNQKEMDNYLNSIETKRISIKKDIAFLMQDRERVMFRGFLVDFPYFPVTYSLSTLSFLHIFVDSHYPWNSVHNCPQRSVK
jgi:phospholipid N-methyltransferase